MNWGQLKKYLEYCKLPDDAEVEIMDAVGDDTSHYVIDDVTVSVDKKTISIWFKA